MLQEIIIPNFRNSAGNEQRISATYSFFGCSPRTAPVVLVNHSLTGNSQVTGETGWWSSLIGPGKTIDTDRFSVLAINIPGNGASNKREDLLSNYKEFSLEDMARVFIRVLEELKLDRLFAAIGGSIGGALAWQLAVLKPELIENLIPIATDIKATDWVLAQSRIQDQILNNSADPVHDARIHAMTFYRTPISFSQKFKRKKNEFNHQWEVENWLEYHGRSLDQRFDLSAYKLMNHLLSTIDISEENEDPLVAASKIPAHIHLVGIDSDLLFVPQEIRETFHRLSEIRGNLSYSEIRSIHGHDAFLIEYEQLRQILNPIFNPEHLVKNEENQYSTFRNR